MPLTRKLIPTVVYLCVTPILISLGMWQLDRAEEKRNFFKIQEQRLQSGPVTLTPNTPMNIATLKYNPVHIVGHYDADHQFLLDNQINAGRAGYFVLSPFILEGSTKAVLVNRGWIPLTKDRTLLPNVTVSDTATTLLGRINSFPSIGLKLTGADTPSSHWPAVVGLIDSAVLAKTLGYPVMPFQIELAADQPDGYQRNWQTTTVMPPEKHTAYATQWFAFALMLTLFFIRYRFKKN